MLRWPGKRMNASGYMSKPHGDSVRPISLTGFLCLKHVIH
jgi:hypothetical protein